MNYDLLGYNADFKNGNITFKIHNDIFKSKPSIKGISDVFESSIFGLINKKINEKVNHIVNQVDVNQLIEDPKLLEDLSHAAKNDIKKDFKDISDDDIIEINNIVDRYIESHQQYKNIKQPGRGAALRGVIMGAVKHLGKGLELSKEERGKLFSDLYNNYIQTH